MLEPTKEEGVRPRNLPHRQILAEFGPTILQLAAMGTALLLMIWQWLGLGAGALSTRFQP